MIIIGDYRGYQEINRHQRCHVEFESDGEHFDREHQRGERGGEGQDEGGKRTLPGNEEAELAADEGREKPHKIEK